MKKTNSFQLILILFMGFIYSPSIAQTQAEMNQEAGNAYKKADKELNEVYKKILQEYKADSVFIKNLKTSQRIWVSFRDAELKMKYPDREDGYYGTIHPLCIANYLEQLTKDRIKTLEEWLDGAEEGDVCSGSVKGKE